MSVAQVVATNPSNAAIDQIEDIRCRADARRMLQIPFFVYLKDNRLNDQQMRDFFCQYYSIVKTSYRMLAAGILNTQPEDTESIGHLVRFLETESGGDVSHLTHYLRWAEHFGIGAADLAAARPTSCHVRSKRR
jgi:pyrroloquinoline quinone (PQQ) biosynthesis protein C